MATRNFIAIDFSHRRLRAIEAVAHRGGIKILRSLSDEVPEGITQDDPSALGRWIGRRLRESGVHADNAIFSVNREHAVTRRLTLPTTNSDELPSMVELSTTDLCPVLGATHTDHWFAKQTTRERGTSESTSEHLSCKDDW